MSKPIDFPQRIVVLARPGELLKHAGRPHIARAKDDEVDDYLAKVRQCPCLHCGMDPAYEAAHVRMASGAHGKASGMGKKPSDNWALPLCPEHHRLAVRSQHNQGERSFWAELGLAPLLICENLYAQRGDLVAMRAVIFSAIAEREAVNQFRGIGRIGKQR
jgi:hypothetical protein